MRTKHFLMVYVISFVGVVGVIGGKERNAHLTRELHLLGEQESLNGVTHSVLHDLHEEPVTEDLLKPIGVLVGCLVLVQEKTCGDL